MRKLAHPAYGVLKTGGPFDPEWAKRARQATPYLTRRPEPLRVYEIARDGGRVQAMVGLRRRNIYLECYFFARFNRLKSHDDNL